MSPAASLHNIMIPSKKRITKALIRCADAQAGLRLCCSQAPEDGFSRVKAHWIVNGAVQTVHEK